MAMTAKFAGTCRWCGTEIVKGDRIMWSRNEGAGHESCAPSCDPAGDREYWAGRADGQRYIDNRNLLGEEYAAAEELAWAMKTGDGW